MACLMPFERVHSQEIDILLKGGHVIDPKNQIDTQMDVAIGNGKIVQLAANIPVDIAKKVVDVSGLYVTPGIIDMHVHVFQGTADNTSIANTDRSQMADAFTFRAGVTTVVDAGSSGWRNFRLFKAQSIDKAQTRILALLNVVGNGMIGRFEEQDVTDMNPDMIAHMIQRLYPELIVGIKSAHYWGDFTSVDRAVQAGELANVPVMVDFGEHIPANSIETLFMQHLRPGDIFTHTFSEIASGRESIVDETTRKIKPFVFSAQQRGIIFDVGHGGGAFAWDQAIPAFRQGFLPDVISTDLHDLSMNRGMKDMANLMSKFMAMGLSIQEVILRTTWNPAKVIQRPDLGHLSVGAEADVAVFNVRQGKFGYTDVRGLTVSGSEKLEAELTIRAGRIAWDLNGISGSQWEAQK